MFKQRGNKGAIIRDRRSLRRALQTYFKRTISIVVSSVLTLGLIGLTPIPAQASTTTGLSYKTYASTNNGASPSTSIALTRTPLSTGTASDIAWNVSGGNVLNSGRSDHVMVNYLGCLVSSTTKTIQIRTDADDGTRTTLDGVQISQDSIDWIDKGGGGGTYSVPFTAGVAKSLNFWFYENGGGAKVFLQWDASGSWANIPADAFRCNHTVTFNANGGSNSMANQTVVSGRAVNLTANAFNRTGYTFAGWNTASNGSGTNYTNTQSVTLSANLNLFARWAANTNVVTFKSNYSGGSGDSTQNITSGVATALTANSFNRAGYTFASWNTSTNGTGTSYSNQQTVTITAPMTLHALWTANTNAVTYDSKGGTAVANGSFTTGGSISTAPTPEPTRSGYAFAGWSATDGGPVVTFPYSPPQTTAITLYAKWTPNSNTVTYDSKGGTAVANGSFTTGGSISTAPTPEPTRFGYTFAGWAATDGGMAITFPYSPPQTTAITLFARWTGNTYTVTYDFDGATGGASPATSSFTSGGTAITLPSPTKNGLLFKGWYSDVNRTNFVARGGAQYSPTADGTLYADWTNIVINLDASTLSSSPTTWTGSLPGAGSESGTVYGNSSLATDGSIKSLTFDGSADGVVFPNSAGKVNGAMTFETWVNPSAFTNSTWQIIATRWFNESGVVTDQDFHFAMKKNGSQVKLNLYTTGSSDIYGSRDFVVSGTSKWYHVGFTIDANNQLQFFVNGQSDSLPITVSRTASTNGNFIIGDTRAGLGFIGKISKVRIYNKALSQSEITASYKSDATAFSHRVITFSANDGTATPATSTQNVGTDTPTTLETSVFTRTGYTLTGWTTSANGAGTSYTTTGTITTSTDVDLFAVWTADSNTVTFNPNYTGAQSATTQSITTDVATELTANSFNRSGYTFAGWNTAANGTGTDYANSESVTIQGPLTLFAVWYRLSITTQPVGKASGTTLQTQPVVRIEDGNGNTVTSDQSTVVTVEIESGADGTLSGTLSATAEDGVASFTNLTLTGTVGTIYVLTFSSTPSWNAAVSQDVTVTPGAASVATSTVTASSTSIVANGSSTSTITVQLKDAQGNNLTAAGETVEVSTSSGGGTISGTTNNNNGTYTATLTSPTTVGSAVIQATVGGSTITDTETISLVAGPATKIAITRAPITGANASNFATQPQITLQDANNNTVILNSSSTVTATLQSGANGTLSGTNQVTFVNGVAEFTNLALTGRTSTNYVLRFAADSFTVDSANLTLTPGTASTATSTVIATDSTLTATGLSSTTITIRLKDAQTNALTTSGGTVTVSVASGGGSLSAVTNNNNGTYTATYTSGTTAGTAVINASLGGTAISDTESITLVHGTAAKIRITQQPTGTASGTALGTQPIIEITDINNNRVVADNSTVVTVAISSGSGGNLGGTKTATAATGLVEFEDLTLSGLVGQSYKLTFSSGSLTAVESASLSVTPGVAVVGTSTISASSSSITANGTSTSTITVQLKDAQGNSLTTNTDTVSIRVDSGTGNVGSTLPAGNGTYTTTFTSSTTAGTSTIRAKLGNTDITDTETITLTPGPATKLGVTVQPPNTNSSGAVLSTQPRVAVQDAFGNTVTSDSGRSITIGVIGNSGSLSGTQTVSTSSGIATFSGITLAGLISENYRLSFSAEDLTGINSDLISITPGAASASTSTITASTNSIVADGSTTSTITVQLKDAQGNLLTAAGETVVVSKASGGGTISETTNNDNGTYTATFTSATTVGTTVIQATVGGSTITDTETITLRHGVANKLVITQAPVAGASNSLLTTQPQVTLQDVNGNTVSSNSVGSVTVAISSGANGTLTGTKTLVLSNGVATFTDLNLAGKTGTNYVLRFESGLFSTTSSNIQVAAGAPSTVTSNVSVSTSSLTANGTSTATITVTLRDSESNQLPGGGQTIALSVTSGFGSIGIITDNANGTYTATYTSGTTVGTATISATLNTAAIAETQTITLVHGPATKVTIAQQPATGASGTSLTTQPKIVLRDANNNIATSDNSSTVTVEIASGLNGSLTGTKTVNVVSGEAAFNDLSFAGIVGIDYKFQFSSGSLTVADSNNLRVTPGVAVVGTSTISASDSSIIANGSTTSEITIQLKDAQGNSLTLGGDTVTIRVSAGTGMIGSISDVGNGTYTSTFTSSTTSGTSTLIASLGGNDITATQDISLIPGAATKLGILTEPPNTTSSGTVLATQPRIAVQDAFGNTVTSDSGRSVVVEVLGNDGSLGGTTTQTSSSGIVTFSGVSLAGLTSNGYRLSFTTSGLTGINSRIITLTPGAASTVTSVVSASTTSIVADGSTTSTITITLKDAQGNLLRATGGTVVISKASGNGSVSTTTDNGDGTYTATFTSPTAVGTTVIQATIDGSTITDTESITLVHGDATQIKITQTPITGANASDFTRQPKITLFDANNNVVTSNSSGTVEVGLFSGDNGTLSGTTQATFENGVATFTNLAITGRTSTDYVLRFTSGSFTVDSGNLTLTPGVASAATSTIVISDSTLIANGSSTATVTVRLKDAQTNALTSSGGTVVISVATGDGSISTVTNNNDGTYTATYISGTVVGTKTITASVNSVTLTDTEQVTLVPGPAAKLLLTQQPTGTSSGTELGTQPIVEITDAFNNRVTGDSSTQVTAAISSGTSGTLGGTRTVTAALGLVTFTDVTLAGLVSQSYKLTFSSGSLIVIESSAISVTPGVAVASTSTISASDTSITANGETTSVITVQLKDAQGNSLTIGGDTVGMRIASGTGTLDSVSNVGNGTYTSTYTSSRVAGEIEIRARLGDNELSATQNLTLTPGAATKLAIYQAPVSQRSGEVLSTQPKISVQDQYGNVVSSDSGRVVTVAISAGDGGSLEGTLTATTVNGIASFTNVILAGITTSNYVLSFTTPNLTSVDSEVLRVSSGSASVTTSTFGVSNSSIVADGETTLVVTVTIRDAKQNALTASAGTLEMFVTAGHQGSIGAVTNNGNGTYTATYTSGTQVSTTIITAQLNGVSLTQNASVSLVAGPATQLSIATEPTGGASAEVLSQQPVIHLLDAFGNHAIQDSTTSVTAAINSGSFGLLGGTTIKQASQGVITFTDLTLAGRVSENYKLRFSSGSLVVADSNNVTVTPGAPSTATSLVSSAVTTLVAESTNTTTVTITLKDAQGNLLITGGASVGLAVSPVTSGFTDLGNVGSVTDQNNGTYTATYTAGTKVQSVRFSATLGGSAISSTSQLSLTHGPAYQIAVEKNPEGGASGSQLTTQPVVLVQDRHENTVTSDNGTVITAALGGFQNSGTLSGSITAATEDGQAAFVGIVMSGRISTQYVLTFTSSGLVSVNSDNFMISQGPTNVTNSAIEADAAAIVANGTSTTEITVSIKDTEGNVVADSAGTVALTVAEGTGSLSPVIDNDNGTYTATFTAGTVSGMARIIGTLDGSALGGNASIILTSGPAENVQILVQPGMAPERTASGELLNNQPAIVIKDIYGNTVTSDSSTVVTLSLKSGDSGTLAGTLTATASSGIAQFSNVSLSGLVGTNYVLEFVSDTSGVRPIDSAPINLIPGTPTQLLLTTPAATANSGQAFETQPTLTAKDAQGNVATNFTADVTASVSGATLQGVTSIPLSSGVATFTDLGMFGTANSSYQITYTTSSLSLSASQSLLLNPGSASYLEIITEPTTEMNGRVFGTQPVIQIRDAQNNAIVTDTPVNVVASINTGSGTLSGTTSVATNSTGRATFNDLMVTGNTGSYTLTFDVVGLSIDSNSFALTPGDQAITRSTFGSTALPNGTYTPTATAYSGLSVAISIASTSATVCSIDQDGEVTFLKMGDCVIKYNQSGNDHWLPAEEREEALTVGRLTQTISFTAIDDQPYGGTDVSLAATAESGLEVTFTVTSESSVCVLNTATTVQIVGLGTCSVVASQSGDEVWAPAGSETRYFEIGTVRPATPTIASVSSGNAQATVSWNPPTHDGGSPILGYRVTSQPGNLTCKTANSTDRSCIVEGLTNGTEYTFVVQALNAIGYSNESTASPEVTPATTADAVVGLTLTSTNKKLTANWIMPEQLGGGSFVRFEMFIRETGGTYGDAFTRNDANLTSFDFTKLDPNDNTNTSDLVNGESYDVKIVIITDAIMAGDQSVTVLAGNSTEATQVPADVAAAPTNATILTTDGTQASVSWIASNSDGGAVITAYSITALANNVAVTCVMQLQLDTNCEISSLTPGQVVNVSIRAVNRIGNSVATTASMTLPTPPAPPTMNTATAGSGFIKVTWAASASDGGMALTGYVAKAMVRGTSQVVAECTTIGTSCDLIVSGTEFDFDFAVWSMNRVGMSDGSNMLSPKRPSVSPSPTPTTSGTRARASGTTNAGATAVIFDARRPMYMPNGQLPNLNVGTTMAWQNGQLVEVNLVSAGTSALQLSAAGGVVLQMQTLHQSGQPMDVAANGMLQVFHNRSIRIAGSGFAPNSLATVWLFSNPVKLGEIQTDANGGFAELFAFNSDIPLGSHTIQINGQHTDGTVRTVAMGVSVFGEDFAPEEVITDASGPTESNSDSNSNQALGVIGAVALAFLGGIGVGALTLSQRRRKS